MPNNDLPDFIEVALGLMETQPKLFQPHDVPGGNLTACEALADGLGVDIGQVKAAASTRLDELTPDEERRARTAITSVDSSPAREQKGPQSRQEARSGPFPAPVVLTTTPAGKTGMNLLGESEEQPAAPVVQGEPAKPLCPLGMPEQSTMGSEFYPDSTIAMPLTGGDSEKTSPLTMPLPHRQMSSGRFPRSGRGANSEVRRKTITVDATQIRYTNPRKRK